MQTSIEEKRKKLTRILKSFDKLAVALSGGVDSALLVAEAYDVLGDRLTAITARSPIHPEQDIADAVALCEDLGVVHWLVDTFELDEDDFVGNTPQRCYVCKMTVFSQLMKKIKDERIDHLAHGANADDLDDYRPGLRAARELGVVAPLMDAGLTKQEIRSMAQARGLKVWNKPAMACLATRIPYGSPVTHDAIEQIKKAEKMLNNTSLRGCRVRHHGSVARIEVPLDQLSRLISEPLRGRLVAKLREVGFMHVCVDLEGYVRGSMNRTVQPDAKDPMPKH
jgi:uncharacterized protein